MASDGFCPKCGALMYGSVCTSCGYGKGKKQSGNAGEFGNQAESMRMMRRMKQRFIAITLLSLVRTRRL